MRHLLIALVVSICGCAHTPKFNIRPGDENKDGLACFKVDGEKEFTCVDMMEFLYHWDQLNGGASETVVPQGTQHTYEL